YLVKTIDSTNALVSESVYQYDTANRLYLLTHHSRAVDNSSSSVESHRWEYNSNSKPVKMVRVKNRRDSTTFNFTQDERGNVAEEEPSARGALSGKYYYYYDTKNRLTDIVRFNAKAQRLLPDYIFEYEENGDLSTMMVVPEGSSDYQKWYYKYDEGGLKLIDFCYNKRNELQGKIEYQYTTGR
ncbi:MAG TPA: hypothetical protein VEZ17_03690, partial [Chitinophagaceae bacterium]|nr:hypothetical protein [Chitinophagaceae bacterium]